MIESQILSKILDDNNFQELNKYNVTATDFEVLPDVYSFIKGYVGEYHSVPDYRTVVSQFADFEYRADVADNLQYLARQLKSNTAKRRAITLLTNEAGNKFSSMNGIEFSEWLYEEASRLKSAANASSFLGSNFAVNGSERRAIYEESKETRTFTYIPTPWTSLTKWLGGGFELGDYVLIQAYANRGKSWLASSVAVKAWNSKFGVLYYSPELTKNQQQFRFDTVNGHFDNVKVRRGELDNEQEYFDYLEKFDASNEVPFIVKTMEDLPKGLSIDVIEADLQAMDNIGMVVIDGFNLMNHGRGGRDGMTQTSRKLRQLFGRYKVAGVVVHQTSTAAEKENKIEDDEIGVREPNPARLDQYSETIALIQDPATVLSFDQHDGVAKLLLAKCREPDVGKVLDMRCNFNKGFLTEATPVDFM